MTFTKDKKEEKKEEKQGGRKVDAPMFDYTPPNFISLLITDLGVLTPGGVSEELIKLYN